MVIIWLASPVGRAREIFVVMADVEYLSASTLPYEAKMVHLYPDEQTPMGILALLPQTTVLAVVGDFDLVDRILLHVVGAGCMRPAQRAFGLVTSVHRMDAPGTHAAKRKSRSRS